MSFQTATFEQNADGISEAHQTPSYPKKKIGKYQVLNRNVCVTVSGILSPREEIIELRFDFKRLTLSV